MLEKVKPTAMGLDGLPDWFIRLSAPAFAEPLTYLFNLSLDQSVVPHQWKSSSITPLPKVRHPDTCNDYRPISITPVVSRIMEKELVRSLIYPVFNHPDYNHFFSDQFAFRPTGSTTSALIYLLHKLTYLLQEHEYVHIIALDFSKAFDSVRHCSLVSKLSNFPVPDCLHNWIVDYLNTRQHLTKVGRDRSGFLTTNASIIQGSGLGPVSYIFSASDLHPVYPLNILFKYADDTYLLVPAVSSGSIPEELKNISQWATDNNLKLNTAKSREMIVCLPKVSTLNKPYLATGLTRVQQLTVLGVTISDTLSAAAHVHDLATKAAASLYALKTLKAHGLQGQPLWDVTQATLVAQLTYASPAWSGFLNSEENSKLQSVLNKATRYKLLTPNCKTIDELFNSADTNLFTAVTSNPDHVLYQLLPPVNWLLSAQKNSWFYFTTSTKLFTAK